MKIFLLIFIIFIIILVSLWLIYILFLKKWFYINKFVNIAEHIQDKELPIKKSYERFNLNYEKFCQEVNTVGYTSVLDLLESLIYYSNSHKTVNSETEGFINELYEFVKTDNPFISSPIKEASLMKTLNEAIENKDTSLGIATLMQLSNEIAAKEKLLIKRNKDNQRSTIISIVGIILTIFFGIFSLVTLF